MILRYSTPEMSALWTDDARMHAWLEVEMAVCEAWTRLGRIPEDAMLEIQQKAGFDVDRVAAALEELSLPPTVRAEQLTLAQFAALSNLL